MDIIVIPFNAAPYELYTTSCQVLTHPHYGHFVMYWFQCSFVLWAEVDTEDSIKCCKVLLGAIKCHK